VTGAGLKQVRVRQGGQQGGRVRGKGSRGKWRKALPRRTFGLFVVGRKVPKLKTRRAGGQALQTSAGNGKFMRAPAAFTITLACHKSAKPQALSRTRRGVVDETRMLDNVEGLCSLRPTGFTTPFTPKLHPGFAFRGHTLPASPPSRFFKAGRGFRAAGSKLFPLPHQG